MSVQLELVFEYSQHNATDKYIYQVRYIDTLGVAQKVSGSVLKEQALEKVSFELVNGDVVEVSERSFLVDLENADGEKMISCRMGALLEGADAVHNITGWVGTTVAPDSEPHPQFSTIYKKQL